MSNRFIALLVGCVLIFFGLVFFVKKDAQAPSNGKAVASNHVQGKGTTGVKLVEFGDFQCPGCKAYYPVLKQIQAKYGDKITFQFRHFPIISSHPNAMSAHRAAEAASLQGKFWEMHDLLYERQDAWKDSNTPATVFKEYAQELNLDIDRYNSDLVRADIGTIIKTDQEAGQKIGVNSTPGLVLDGKLLNLDNIRGINDLYKLIDTAIASHADN